MYTQIIDELNNFLRSLKVNNNLINPDEFQAVFVKKLSNQNVTKDKRRIPAGSNISPVNQTHIDITGQDGMLFFFESLIGQTTRIQNFDVDLYVNNYKCLESNNEPQILSLPNGTKLFSRGIISITNLSLNSNIYHSAAYKKHGHAGEQVQINIPDSDEWFTKLHKFAFLDDALVMLRYDYFHYLAILIPSQFCSKLYELTGTSGIQNVNYVALNPAYNIDKAKELQQGNIVSDYQTEIDETNNLQESLQSSNTAGTDVERMVKARVSQGSFRRLLLLSQNHKCNLCDITTTSVLRASHIREWSDSSKEERIDAENGLLLCANHDALFDRHLISFNPDTGNLCISNTIDEPQKVSLNLSNSYNIALSERMKSYMEIHYKKFKDKEA